MKPLLLLDFDTTLFKTNEFWNDFAVVFAKVSGKPEDTYVNHYADFTSGVGQSRKIDYDSLLAHAHIAAEPVRQATKDQLGQKSYIFDDARILIKELPHIQKSYDVAVLTFGQVAFQNLKIEHAPEIASIPIHITQQLKNNYIKQNFMDRPGGVLVDDKPDQELPSGWIEILSLIHI